ncbi:MAG: phosphoribosylformylglycinamidine synthase subunit PurQ, partial [Duncaniella sp.]|nr:phosphoribosylformylglycinamidine synthase subunit PurQ [Duncaniella sp.]
TNIVGTPLKDGIRTLSLSANWMWPCKNPGEDAALYRAVEACSDFACAIGVNIPTGKDSLSMTQKYGADKVYAPGTVIISAAGEVTDVRKTLTPVLSKKPSSLYLIDFSSDALKLGGSAFAQMMGHLGDDAPTVTDPAKFVSTFDAVQTLMKKNLLLAAHDVSAGGLVTTLLEMTFGNMEGGVELDTTALPERDLIKILFAENPALVVQVEASKTQKFEDVLTLAGARYYHIGAPTAERTLIINHEGTQRLVGIDHMRDVWMHTSYLLDALQSGPECAALRYENYKKQPIRYRMPSGFDGKLASRGIALSRKGHSDRVRAAIIREKGVNGDREMAYSLYLAGFDVKDVHMTDLMSGRETLEDVNMIVFCGGFSNSDVLGSAKGWASGFRYNENARRALENFYKRTDTLSLGICNGCQLMIELDLINPGHEKKTRMLHNDSHKFESQFLGLTIPQNKSVMFGSLSGSKLGIWVAHGEGKFNLPLPLDRYNVVAKYAYNAYPANPNGSRSAVAGICSDDGRHLAMMPHLERAIFPWQCGYYPASRRTDEVTPWIDAFINARKWVEEHVSH